jgi:hypothetical protein
MAKKTRIDRRGKIRSLVRKFPIGDKPHWAITKRASVNRRRRIVDDLWLADTITLSDLVVPDLNRLVASGITMSDAQSINDEMVILGSATITDDGTIVKNFESPSNASGATITDSIGFELASFSSIFNATKINIAVFNGLGYDQEFYNDSITMSDGVSLNASNALSDSVSVSDSIGVSFIVSSIFNAGQFNLSQFNS